MMSINDFLIKKINFNRFLMIEFELNSIKLFSLNQAKGNLG